MKVILVFFALSSISAFAANKYYHIDMDLAIDGKKISTPNIFAKNNMTETVLEGNRFYEVTATENSTDQTVKMDFVIGEIAADGERIILSKPSVLTKEGKTATMTTNRLDGSEEMSLTVTPVVKSL